MAAVNWDGTGGLSMSCCSVSAPSLIHCSVGPGTSISVLLDTRLLKSVLTFLTNQTAWFISRGIGCSYFSGNLRRSFLLWHDVKILAESRRGGTFLSLALSAIVQQKCFFNRTLIVQSFTFWIWIEKFWTWFIWKLQTKTKIYIAFERFPFLTSCTTLKMQSWSVNP